jgi:cellulase
MECVQIKVTSAGAKTLPAGVAIPGTYTATDPGILFNLYSGSITSYTIPGPAVWNGASGGAAPVASSAAAVTSKAAVTSAAAVSSKAAVSTKAAVTSKAVVTSAPVVVATSAPVVAPSAAPVVKTTLVTLVRSSTKVATVVASPTAAPATGGTVGKYMQCGGLSYKGATVCESGWTCKVQNPYYSQCVSA